MVLINRMSNYVTEYVPDKWKNLRLEYTDEYINSLKKQKIKKIQDPKIMKKPVKSTNSVSVLKNKSDVNKESHKFCEGEQCINKNNRCVIL